MLIARAPVRISFAGGGTDLEAYYREHGGLVVSTSIDKYFYVFVNLSAGDLIQITASDYRGLRDPQGGHLLWVDRAGSRPHSLLVVGMSLLCLRLGNRLGVSDSIGISGAEL